VTADRQQAPRAARGAGDQDGGISPGAPRASCGRRSSLISDNVSSTSRATTDGADAAGGRMNASDTPPLLPVPRRQKAHGSRSDIRSLNSRASRYVTLMTIRNRVLAALRFAWAIRLAAYALRRGSGCRQYRPVKTAAACTLAARQIAESLAIAVRKPRIVCATTRAVIGSYAHTLPPRPRSGGVCGDMTVVDDRVNSAAIVPFSSSLPKGW
jgi:hypothetical protein